MRTQPSRTLNDVGTLWSLRRREEKARCALLSRPPDWELRVLVNGETRVARRCRDTNEAFALAVHWKRQWLAEGWQQVLPTSVGAQV